MKRRNLGSWILPGVSIPGIPNTGDYAKSPYLPGGTGPVNINTAPDIQNTQVTKTLAIKPAPAPAPAPAHDPVNPPLTQPGPDNSNVVFTIPETPKQIKAAQKTFFTTMNVKNIARKTPPLDLPEPAPDLIKAVPKPDMAKKKNGTEKLSAFKKLALMALLSKVIQ